MTAEREAAEQALRDLTALMLPVLLDGARKRAAGAKVHWRRDGGHLPALYRHLRRWETGERVDPDSGAHPLVHVAVRALMLAAQEVDDA